MTKYGNRETPLERLLKEKDIDGLRLDQFQEVINRIIKPYIVKRPEGYCTILIPLFEWDKMAEKIFEGMKNERNKHGSIPNRKEAK